MIFPKKFSTTEKLLFCKFPLYAKKNRTHRAITHPICSVFHVLEFPHLLPDAFVAWHRETSIFRSVPDTVQLRNQAPDSALEPFPMIHVLQWLHLIFVLFLQFSFSTSAPSDLFRSFFTVSFLLAILSHFSAKGKWIPSHFLVYFDIPKGSFVIYTFFLVIAR